MYTPDIQIVLQLIGDRSSITSNGWQPVPSKGMESQHIIEKLTAPSDLRKPTKNPCEVFSLETFLSDHFKNSSTLQIPVKAMSNILNPETGTPHLSSG